jgi:hypothetical protein
MKTDKIREALDGMVAAGDAKVVGWRDGEPLFQLTDSGIAKARVVYERYGLDPDDPDGRGTLELLLGRIDAAEQAETS